MRFVYAVKIVERNGRLCGCTQSGCLEAYSSASALVQEVQEHLNAGVLLPGRSQLLLADWFTHTQLHLLVLKGADTTLASHPLADINVKLIFEHAAKGDPMCVRLIAEVGLLDRHRRLLRAPRSLKLSVLPAVMTMQAADYLGFACVSFCRILDPEVRPAAVLRAMRLARRR